MDHSACHEFIRENALPLLQFMGCQHWSVNWRTERIDDPDTRGLCWPSSSYENATIKIDPDKCSDSEQLLDTMFHEVCHLILAPAQDALNSVRDALPKEARKVARPFVVDAVERSVLNLERAWNKTLRALYVESRKPRPETPVEPGPVGPRPRTRKARPCRPRP